MKKIILLLLFSIFLLNSCNSVRKSAGVTRKSLDEFQVIENPPLVIPPDFNLMPPEQIEDKKIDNVDSNLAEEILFGLEEQDTKKTENNSLMKHILNNVDADSVDPAIRNEIDENFANEKSSNQLINVWNTDEEIDNAINDSETSRNDNNENDKDLI